MQRIHLSKKIKLWINLVGAGVWVSGLGWVVVHFLLGSQDSQEFPASSSEPLWLKAHGAFAFLALWTGGLLWGLHVVKAWHSRRHRVSGATLFCALLVLMITGYLLYYVADDTARRAVSWSHWVLGLCFPMVYLIHRMAKKIRRRGLTRSP